MDFELHSFRRILVSHDTVEGEAIVIFVLLTYGTLNNTVQSKLSLSSSSSLDDKSVVSSLKLGLFSYPVLQAADILIHRFVGLKSFPQDLIERTRSVNTKSSERLMFLSGMINIST